MSEEKKQPAQTPIQQPQKRIDETRKSPSYKNPPPPPPPQKTENKDKK
jgi:hypothetical protein